ncbi:MAG: hypothetical protein ACJA2D_001932 [Pseudohongiellaceae bacterium]|jgi:hypothetical protein
MLEGFDCPAILVSIDNEILATNQHYETAFGELKSDKTHRCFEVSHGYKVPAIKPETTAHWVLPNSLVTKNVFRIYIKSHGGKNM